MRKNYEEEREADLKKIMNELELSPIAIFNPYSYEAIKLFCEAKE